MPFDLLQRKRIHFVLWRPRITKPPPALVIGTLQAGNPPSFQLLNRFDLAPSPVSADLWEVAAAACGLVDNCVYHYWLEVTNANPKTPSPTRILCTDPTASTVDWRLRAPLLPPPFTDNDRSPAAVIKWRNGELIPSDPGGEQPDWGNDAPLDGLPANNRLVIYELPTRWGRIEAEGTVSIGGGTFRDVLALVERTAAPSNFAGVAALAVGQAHLEDLGVNALELLPPADSFVDREWGYATSNYFAADFDLGFPNGHASPTASADLAALVTACHRHGIRFFADVVMAFATRYAYRYINFLDFHVQPRHGRPGGGRARRLWRRPVQVQLPDRRLRPGRRRNRAPRAGAPAHDSLPRALDARLSHRRHPHGQREQRRELGLRPGVQGPRREPLASMGRAGPAASRRRRTLPRRRRGASGADRSGAPAPSRRALERRLQADGALRDPGPERPRRSRASSGRSAS